MFGKILRWTGFGFMGLLLALVVVGLLIPRHSHMQRAIDLKARPATVFAVLNGFARFNDWSPWAGLDPKAKYARTGPETGVGAKLAWQSDDPNVGSGSQEIVESVPNRSIVLKLAFEGFAQENHASFTLTPIEGGTHVVWGYDGDSGFNLMGRYFSLFCDRFIGPDYERGLQNLKKLVESLPDADLGTIHPEVVDVPAVTLAYVSGTTSTDPDIIGTAYAVAIGRVSGYLHNAHVKAVGAPRAIARKWDPASKTYEYDIGLPVPEGTPPGVDVHVSRTYSGRAVKELFRGSDRNLSPTYDALFAYLGASGLQLAGNPWEEYVTDPASAPSGKMVTNIYLPVR